MRYRVVETNARVANIEPALVTRLHWRAKRAWRKENEHRLVPFYRWEILKEDGKWKVVAMQNEARMDDDDDTP